MTSSLDTAPASVQEWFAARADGDAGQRIRAVLAEDASLVFAGRTIQGADAVTAHLLSSPNGGRAPIDWSVLSQEADRLTVRGTGPGGAPLPSPGGPMSAMDFAFTLDGTGLIRRIEPHPHHTEPRDLSAPLSPGRQAPGFTLPDTSGRDVTLTPAGAAATVVLFTCNACPWALGWHDRLQAVARDYAAQGVAFLQINANDPALSPKDALAVSQQRVADGLFASPYLVDEGQRVARAWGARHTPDVFVLTPDGAVAYHGAPDADAYDESLDAPWLRSALDAVLADQPVATPETTPIGCTIKWTMA